MRVRLLGTAAGGGLPQWNCACTNCRAARAGTIPARTQSSVAVSTGDRWILVNASPDLRAQIEAFPSLQPRTDTVRNSPIAAVLLTNADLDHVLGLPLLREGGPLPVYASAAVTETLTTSLRLDGTMTAVRWTVPGGEYASVFAGEDECDLQFRAIPLPGGPPPYARGTSSEGVGHSVAYQFADRRSGRHLLVAPDVAAITPELRAAMENSDAILFDGTFWSDDEMVRCGAGTRTAVQMGHVPICDGSLPVLREMAAARRIFLHINNTNPILAADSPERVTVERAGVVIGEDGMEFEL